MCQESCMCFTLRTLRKVQYNRKVFLNAIVLLIWRERCIIIIIFVNSYYDYYTHQLTRRYTVNQSTQQKKYYLIYAALMLPTTRLYFTYLSMMLLLLLYFGKHHNTMYMSIMVNDRNNKLKKTVERRLGAQKLTMHRTWEKFQYKTRRSYSFSNSVSYAAWSIKPFHSAILASFNLIFINQPSAVGESLIVSGLFSSAEFTSVTSPDTGQWQSDAALTDSTDPNVSPAANWVPTEGSSTYTTSPNASAACWEMPTVPILPSIFPIEVKQ